jgi:ABC-2 type transport system ATP-binding protein
MSELIETRNLTRLYGTVIGVNDISLTLPKGAYGLLGPNGAGKTTLLNLMTGQLRPTLGSIRMLGQQPRNNSAFLSQIGYLPGNEGMYSNVAAIDWVSYLTQLHGYSKPEASERARRALAQVRMSDHMHRQIATFSRGMRQRTRLAQAIAHEPQLLILDEPFNGLDPIARHEMTVFLQQWTADGRSLFLASHVLHEIESITRSFLLICGGRLLASGAADDIHEMLADLPSDVRLKTDAPGKLAAGLIQAELVDSVRLEGDSKVCVTTRAPLKLYEFLASCAETENITVTEVHSADESLQDVFNSLMRIHRGEL